VELHVDSINYVKLFLRNPLVGTGIYRSFADLFRFAVLL
jgi:hypothetical protein